MRYQDIHKGIIDNNTGGMMSRPEIEKRLNEYDAWHSVDSNLEIALMLLKCCDTTRAERHLKLMIEKAFDDEVKKEVANQVVREVMKLSESFEEKSMWTDLKDLDI